MSPKHFKFIAFKLLALLLVSQVVFGLGVSVVSAQMKTKVVVLMFRGLDPAVSSACVNSTAEKLNQLEGVSAKVYNYEQWSSAVREIDPINTTVLYGFSKGSESVQAIMTANPTKPIKLAITIDPYSSVTQRWSTVNYPVESVKNYYNPNWKYNKDNLGVGVVAKAGVTQTVIDQVASYENHYKMPCDLAEEVVGAVRYLAPPATTDTAVTAESTSTTATTTSSEKDGLIKLLIPIPVCNQELLSAQEIQCSGQGWTTHVKDITSYINTYFNLAIVAGIVVFAFMAILSGFQILLSSLNFIQTKKVTTRLKRSGVGLITLMFSWILLNQINPSLTDIKISKIGEISELGCCQLTGKEEFYWMKETKNDKGEISYTCDAGHKKVDVLKCSAIAALYEEGEEDIGGLPTPSSQMVLISGDNILNPDKYLATQEVVNGTKEAAHKFSITNNAVTLRITSGYRTWEQQQQKIAENCPPAKGLSWPTEGTPPKEVAHRSIHCNPPTALNLSAHNLGIAVDVWGFQNGKQCIMQKQCNKSNPATDPCRTDKCQALIIEAMQDAGFCNLSIEAWHFEKPAKSPTCTKMPDYSK